MGDKGDKRNRLLEKLKPYIMVGPAMFFLVIFTFYPMVNLVYLSFFDYNLVNPIKRFVGFRNYETLFFIKRDFMIALKNTTVYTVATVVLLILLALLFAVWFQKDKRINRFAQTALFTPHLIAMLSCAMI